MSVYNNRFLVLIGGETELEESKKQVAKPKVVNEDKKSDESEDDDGEPQNRPLNDVWVYDILLNIWREITTTVKVQTSFNSKKMRKIFEPRMAHSANVFG